MRKHRLILPVLVAVTIGSFATAQKVQPPPPQLDAAQLEKLAAVPSLDQAILRLAAEKLRQEKKPMATVDVQITVKISKTPTNGCIGLCYYSGNNEIYCDRLLSCPD